MSKKGIKIKVDKKKMQRDLAKMKKGLFIDKGKLQELMSDVAWDVLKKHGTEKAMADHIQEFRLGVKPLASIPDPNYKKRTPVRDYLRMAAIIAVAVLGAHFLLGKISGPPKGALYQIHSGPLRQWTNYAITKPSLTPSGCVVWFDLKGNGNIFCGEFVIAEVPGRVKHE